MRPHWPGLVLLSVLLAMPWHPAAALQFHRTAIDATHSLLDADGPIVQGDLRRLRQALDAAPAGQPVIALALDSPGGSVFEAEQMAVAIREADLAVIIPSDSKCASACFLLLAAAPRRFAAPDALIGVHSASQGGSETLASMAVTTAMARAAAKFGVPPGILGKMVQTTPGRMEWLTRDDLNAMDVTILGDAAKPAASRQAPAAPAPAALPAPGMPAAAGPAEHVVASYQGAFFCGQRPASLSLRVIQPSGGASFRVETTFGPSATNPGFPRGSFTMGGRMELAGNNIDLRPESWLSQPAGHAMIGLVGHSGDQGASFSGRVTAAPDCTMFTLRRVNPAG